MLHVTVTIKIANTKLMHKNTMYYINNVIQCRKNTASGTFNISFPIEFKFLIMPEFVQSLLKSVNKKTSAQNYV